MNNSFVRVAPALGAALALLAVPLPAEERPPSVAPADPGEAAFAAAIRFAEARRTEEALAQLKVAKAAFLKSRSGLDPIHREVAIGQAAMHEARGELEEAVEFRKEALTRTGHFHRENTRQVDDALQNLVNLYGGLERWDEMEPLLRRQQKIRAALFGEDSPPVGGILQMLGVVQTERGDAAGALETAKQALALFRKLHGETPHVEIAGSLVNYGEALRVLGRFEDARAAQVAAREMFQAAGGEAAEQQAAQIDVNITQLEIESGAEAPYTLVPEEAFPPEILAAIRQVAAGHRARRRGDTAGAIRAYRAAPKHAGARYWAKTLGSAP